MVRRKIIDKKILTKMQHLREKGYSYSQISLELRINYFTVKYHLNEKYKERVKKRSRIKTKSDKDYMRIYQAERYKNDPLFREKQKKRSRDYKRKIAREKKKEEKLKNER